MTTGANAGPANAKSAGNVLPSIWSAAGFAQELNGGVLLARHILGEPLLVFREAGNAPVALAACIVPSGTVKANAPVGDGRSRR